MGDKFIDDLVSDLQARRTAEQAAKVDAQNRRDRFGTAVQQWWAAFADILGQKVGAWNEKRVSPVVHFTKHEDGSVRISHETAEIVLRLQGNNVVSRVERGGDVAERPLIILSDRGSGGVTAVSGGEELSTPTEAAELVIKPLLIEAYRLS